MELPHWSRSLFHPAKSFEIIFILLPTLSDWVDPNWVLLMPDEWDKVQQSRAETLFVDQGMEKGELVL